MDTKQYCKLCDERHVPGQHNTRDVKPRPWIKEFLSGRPSSVPVAATKPRKAVTKVHPDSQSFVTCQGPDCANLVPVKAKGRPSRFCGTPCRVAAHRASRRK